MKNLTRTMFFMVYILSIVLIGVAYKFFGTLIYTQFTPQCIVKKYTGIDCPACGSQRAIEHLLNGDFHSAFILNPLIFILLPYILVLVYVQFIPRPTSFELKLKNIFLNKTSLKITVGLLSIYTIVRNIFL